MRDLSKMEYIFDSSLKRKLNSRETRKMLEIQKDFNYLWHRTIHKKSIDLDDVRKERKKSDSVYKLIDLPEMSKKKLSLHF
jgi:hypothetical protein